MLTRKHWLAVGLALAGSLAPLTAGVSGAQGATWVRGYPENGPSGCVDYVAQWSDGTFTSVPWDCGPGKVGRRGTLTAQRSYPQIARNGCTEYITQWSDGSFTWVPFSCPPGVAYFKPADSDAAGANPTGGVIILQPVSSDSAAPASDTPTAPTLPTLQPVNPAAPAPNLPNLPNLTPLPTANTAPASSQPAATREYILSQDGFSLSLPTNWNRVDIRETGLNNRPAEVRNLYKFLAEDSEEVASLIVLKGPRNGANSISAIFQRNPSTSNNKVTSTTVSEDRIQLPSGEAFKEVTDLEIRTPTGRVTRLRSATFYILAGSEIVILDFTADAADFGRYAPVFDQIAKSFRLM